MIEFPNIQTQRLAVKLKLKAEKLVKQGHPWVFEDSITKINKQGNAGDITVLFDQRRDKVFAIGLYDPDSPIRIKMISASPMTIGTDFFKEKITIAFSKRNQLLKTDTDSYRFIFGENDGFPGFIADVYKDVLVVKLYTAIWFPYLEMILPELVEVSGSNTVVMRLSRNLERSNAYGVTNGQVIDGILSNEVVYFKEHGVRFSANVIHGHKTGYFLDHRHNRKRVGDLSKGKRILDVFSYAGGFSVHALAGGATEVISLDISAQALKITTAY